MVAGLRGAPRVSRARVVRAELPLDLDLGEHYGRIETLGYVLVGLVDDAGHTGVGWTFSIDPKESRQIESAMRERMGLVEAMDPAAFSRNWESLASAAAALPRAVGAPCVSAFDVALWDLCGRQREEPVHRLLGATAQQLNTYASDDLWPSLGTDALAANAARFVAQGFGTVKIRTGGSSDPEAEFARVAAVQEAVGDGVVVLYDALQRYDVESAIALGRALEPCGLGWFEDPVSENDLRGLARVTESVDIPVASGEDATWPAGHRALLAHRCVDVLMVDPKWVGGITPWRTVAAEAAQHGIAMSSHISPELSAPILAAYAPEALLEWFSWSFGLYETAPSVEAGVYSMPEGAGFGLAYRPDLLDCLFG